MRKLLSLILIVTLISSMLVGCSSTEPVEKVAENEVENNDSVASNDEGKTEDLVSINFMTFSANAESGITLDSLKESFEKENPNIKVEIETLGYDDYFTQLQTKFLGNDAPDCFESNFENFVAYADKGLLADIGPMLETSDVDLNMLNKETVSAFNLKDTQYGMPYSFSNVVMVYNQDLFDQADVSYPDSSWTWADVDEAGIKIRNLGEDVYGYYQPISFYEFFKAAEQNGGGVLNEDKTEFNINSPQNIETLENMMARVNDSNIMPTDSQMGGMGDWDLFLTGRLGMIITGIWAFPTFTEQAGFDWDIAVEPGNTDKATHFFANGLAIYSGSEKQDAAFKWVSYLSASKDVAQFRIDKNWELSPSLYEDILDQYTKVTPPASKDVVFESLDYLITTPTIVEFSKTSDIIGQELSAAVTGAKTAKEALDDAQERLESEIDL